jgi:hypothetical protein
MGYRDELLHASQAPIYVDVLASVSALVSRTIEIRSPYKGTSFLYMVDIADANVVRRSFESA